MTIVGFNFTKISVERKATPKGKINIGNNVAIKSVEKANLNFGKAKQSALKFTFEFKASYEPKIAEILMLGEVIYMDTAEMVESIAKDWKKDKKVPPEVMTLVLNNVMNKCNIEALLLSREMNLPPPIPLPKVTPKQ